MLLVSWRKQTVVRAAEMFACDLLSHGAKTWEL